MPRDGGLAAGQQHARRLKGLAPARHLQRDAPQRLAHVACLAFNGIAQDVGREAGFTRHGSGSFQRQLRRSDWVRLDRGQARITGLQRFAFAAFEQCHRLGRYLDGVAPQDGQGIAAMRWIGDGGTRGDVGRIVAGHVGHQQVHHLGRVAGGCQAAALDGGQVAAHAVHLADAGPAGQQGPVQRLFVSQREAGQGQGQQGGAAARDEAQHHVVGAQAGHGLQQPTRGDLAGRIGHRVCGLHDLDGPARHAVAVAGDHQA